MFGKGEKFKYRAAVAGLVGLSVKIKKVYISVAVQLPAGEGLVTAQHDLTAEHELEQDQVVWIKLA